jgi:hypothetical protein
MAMVQAQLTGCAPYGNYGTVTFEMYGTESGVNPTDAEIKDATERIAASDYFASGSPSTPSIVSITVNENRTITYP